MPEQKDPLVNGYFQVEFGAKLTGAWKEVSGLIMEYDVAKIQQSGGKGMRNIAHSPTQQKLSNITLKRGMTDDKAAWTWFKEVAEGKVKGARTNGSVVVYDQAGMEKFRWDVENAWPCRISIPSLDSESNSALIEELELTYEAIKVTAK